MSLDLYAIGTALAAQLGTVTAPAGTDGGTAIRQATVLTPNDISMLPAIVVELPHGEVADPAGGIQDGIHDFEAYFVFGKNAGDIPRAKKVMLKWLGPLLNATYSAMKLGLASSVTKSEVVSYEYGTYNYGTDEYHSWHLTVRVWTTQTVTVTA